MSANFPGTKPLRRLRGVDRAAWVARVREAMRDAGGRIPDAAAALGVHERTLYRWLDDTDPSTQRMTLAATPRVRVGVRRC